MKIYIKLILLITTFAMVLNLGCSDRGVNTIEKVPLQEGSVSPLNHVMHFNFQFQVGNGFQDDGFSIQRLALYVPKVSFPHINGGSLQPVPLLILLAPEDGDHYYYFNHGLKDIANELISNGTIQPMAIACLSNKNNFELGGMFYAGHLPVGGKFDNLFKKSDRFKSIISYLNFSYPFIIDSPDKRGIGGMGQGAYGALRATILNPGLYNSISVLEGPLDFDGADGNSGMLTLFDDMLNEQGLLNGNMNDILIKDVYKISRMFIGAAYAFSPHDTAVFISLDADQVNINLDSTHHLDDSATLVISAIPLNSYHLPFDSTATLYNPIWDTFWLPNNLENLLTPGVLNGINIWMGTSTETDFANYYDQTQSFLNTLSAEYPVEVFDYTGYPGKPAGKDQYLYDLLKEMLIFHNDNFGN